MNQKQPVDIAPLLQILQNPEHPGFAQAIAKLSNVDPATLPPHQIPILLAQIESAIAGISTHKQHIAQELHSLRHRAAALTSYKR